MTETKSGAFDELDEPGVFSGLMTLLGAGLGVFLVGYNYLYGPAEGFIADLHIAAVIGIGAVFTFLSAAFTFLIGWIVEIVWPLLGALLLVGALIALPLIFYFGVDVVSEGVSRAFLFG